VVGEKGRKRPLDSKVRERLDLSAAAPPLGTIPVETIREGAPAQMASSENAGVHSASPTPSISMSGERIDE
jgi:hypothetical protein